MSLEQMQVQILGSGGATTTPKPLCQCHVCVEAREKGVPYSRTGPAVFVHGPDVLIDTPEEIKAQLNRSGIRRIAAAFYSHWHPDHVMGVRVWEMNCDWSADPPRTNCPINIYLPEQVASDFKNGLGTWHHLSFMESRGLIRLRILGEAETVEISRTRITPVRLAESYMFAFLFEQGQQRVFIAPDELFGWSPPANLHGIDLAVLPIGVPHRDPLTGQQLFPDHHPVLNREATFEDTLKIIQQLKAKRTVLTHIDEYFGFNHDYYVVLEQHLSKNGLNVRFAYDTLIVS